MVQQFYFWGIYAKIVGKQGAEEMKVRSERNICISVPTVVFIIPKRGRNNSWSMDR